MHPDKFKEWRWFGKDALPANIAFPTSHTLLHETLDDVARDGNACKRTLVFVSMLIINEKQQILFGKPVGSNVWTHFCFFMKDKDKGTLECVQRVAQELLGISVYKPHLYANGDGMNVQPMNEPYTSEHFIVQNFSGEPQNLHPEEFSELKWFSKETLPKKEEFNKDNGIQPEIVIVPHYGRESSLKILSYLSYYFFPYKNVGWTDSYPSYFTKVDNLIYYTNGSIDLKKYIKHEYNTRKILRVI